MFDPRYFYPHKDYDSCKEECDYKLECKQVKEQMKIIDSLIKDLEDNGVPSGCVLL